MKKLKSFVLLYLISSHNFVIISNFSSLEKNSLDFSKHNKNFEKKNQLNLKKKLERRLGFSSILKKIKGVLSNFKILDILVTIAYLWILKAVITAIFLKDWPIQDNYNYRKLLLIKNKKRKLIGLDYKDGLINVKNENNIITNVSNLKNQKIINLKNENIKENLKHEKISNLIKEKNLSNIKKEKNNKLKKQKNTINLEKNERLLSQKKVPERKLISLRGSPLKIYRRYVKRENINLKIFKNESKKEEKRFKHFLKQENLSLEKIGKDKNLMLRILKKYINLNFPQIHKKLYKKLKKSVVELFKEKNNRRREKRKVRKMILRKGNRRRDRRISRMRKRRIRKNKKKSDDFDNFFV